ncbi:MAG TPA: hypothetical protein VIC83_06135 [Candidatus Limnocylindria bacterium]|jgi:hypothetical protein
MPFLPFVLLLVWQAIGKSASFALGWATALYFGQVPGKQGRALAIISLAAAGWILLLAGFALPLLVGAAADAVGVVPRNFDVERLTVLALGAALVLTPPLIAGITVWVGFHDDRSLGRWLRLVLPSYPATASLGVGVLQMVVFTPFLIVERIRRKREVAQMALSMKPGTDDEALKEAVTAAVRSLGVDRMRVHKASGFLAWPLRTVGFAVTTLLGAIVRGEPVYLAAGGVELYAYATNVAVIGPGAKVRRTRAALEREVPFHGAHLTWSEDSQRLEDELIDIWTAGGGVQAGRRRLSELQRRIDSESLNVEEWNVLDRLRLEVEMRALEQGDRQVRASA